MTGPNGSTHYTFSKANRQSPNLHRIQPVDTIIRRVRKLRPRETPGFNDASPQPSRQGNYSDVIQVMKCKLRSPLPTGRTNLARLELLRICIKLLLREGRLKLEEKEREARRWRPSQSMHDDAPLDLSRRMISS
jgi:hypothetical protein